MPASKDVILVYDGTYYGMLCCFYYCVYARMVPTAIVTEECFEPTLFEEVYINTDTEKAKKVQDSFAPKINGEVPSLVRDVFLSCLKDKELALLKFLMFAYRQGAKAMGMISHPLLSPLLDAKRHLFNEVHHYKGFVRFVDYDSALVAQISPKNFVLPYLEQHFCSRYRNENFMIYDDTHRFALIYENGVANIAQVEQLQKPELTADEAVYEQLWKQFYNTITITSRRNEKNRRSFMPKRFWSHLTEMSD